MKRFLFIQAILISCYFGGNAQVINLYNYVGVAEHQGEPIIGAQFSITQNGKVVAITNELGEFNFKSEHEKLYLGQIGFETVEVKATESFNKIELKSDEMILHAVVVSENKSESKLQNSTISLEIIKPELISNTAPTNIEESIGRINGVQVVDNQPTIRGGSGWSYGAGSRVQVLVNNMPILSGDAGQALWTFIPTEGIESVEVLKGASSVLYGSSALNGVINIKTQQPKDKPFTQVSLSSGLYDLAKRESLHFQGEKRNSVSNLTAYHTAMYKNIGVTLGLNALKDEGYRMGDNDDRVRVNIGLQRKFAEKNLLFGVNASAQVGNSSSFLLWESFEKGYTALDSNFNKTNTTRVNIDPHVSWYKGNVSQYVNTRFLYIDNQVDNGDPTIDQSNTSNLFYGEYRIQYKPEKLKINLNGGLVAINSTTASPLYNGNQKAANYAAYAQLDKSWNRFLVSGGARYEHFRLNDRQEGRPVFRLGANYQLASFTFLRASYGEGYRFPSIAESYITTTVGPVSIYPNDQLKSETGTNVEFGIKQGFKIKKLNGFLDLAIFRMEYTDMMEFTFGQWGSITPPLFGSGFKTVNTGRTRIQGYEANVAYAYKVKDLEIQGFLGFTHNTSKALQPNLVFATDNSNQPLTYLGSSSNTEGNVLKYRPANMAKADVIMTYKKVRIGYGLSYQSEMQNVDLAFVSDPIKYFVPGIQESMQQGLTKYWLSNARIGIKANSHFSSNLILSNILNREYVVRPADIGAPRSVRLQVTYTF
jgi:outer membrane receptor for ferrienterochelin and colicins